MKFYSANEIGANLTCSTRETRNKRQQAVKPITPSGFIIMDIVEEGNVGYNVASLLLQVLKFSLRFEPIYSNKISSK